MSFTDSRKKVLLFNPFHDRIGRFTGRAQAVAISDSAHAKITAHRSAKLSDEEKTAVTREVDKISSYLKSKVSDMPSKVSVTVTKRTKGAHAWSNPDEDKLEIHPRVVRGLTKGNLDGSSVILHEMLHKRGFDRGRVSKEKINKKWARMAREEGLNSLLTDKHMRAIYGSKAKPFEQITLYRTYMEVVASYSYDAAGGNTDKAWKIIETAHKEGYEAKSVPEYEAMVKVAIKRNRQSDLKKVLAAR